jgi:hypothetical protein
MAPPIKLSAPPIKLSACLIDEHETPTLKVNPWREQSIAEQSRAVHSRGEQTI